MNTGKKKLIVVDIDGTFADSKKWQKQYFTNGVSDEEGYHNHIMEFPVNEMLLEMVNMYIENNRHVLFLSARESRYYNSTMQWFDNIPVDIRNFDAYQHHYCHVILKSTDTESHKWKIDTLNSLTSDYDIELCIDDNPKVCQAFREAGYSVLQMESQYETEVKKLNNEIKSQIIEIESLENTVCNLMQELNNTKSETDAEINNLIKENEELTRINNDRFIISNENRNSIQNEIDTNFEVGETQMEKQLKENVIELEGRLYDIKVSLKKELILNNKLRKETKKQQNEILNIKSKCMWLESHIGINTEYKSKFNRIKNIINEET